jgi:hypothetical protein
MPVFSVGSSEFAEQRVNILASGTAWLAMAGARKLIAARHEARLNASQVAMLATIARDF